MNNFYEKALSSTENISPYGSGRAARFGTTYEVGGGNNSRYAIIALIPMWQRNNLPRIRYRVFMKTPNSAVFWGQTDSPYNSLFWWGNTSIRANGGNAVMNGLSIWTGGSPGTQRASLYYTFAPNTWYLFDFDVKLDPTYGFVTATVSKADGSAVASMTWNGAIGTDGDANGYYTARGARASAHSLSSSVATSTDLNYFVTMGPVLAYEPGAG